MATAAHHPGRPWAAAAPLGARVYGRGFWAALWVGTTVTAELPCGS